MSSLREAVIKKDLRVVNIYLSGPCLASEEKDQALLIAVKEQSSEIVKCLLNAGADVKICDPNDNSLLILSVSANDARTTKLLLDAKCNPNRKGSSRCTPLHIASKRSFDDCLELLIEYGGNVNIKDSNGCTPLIHAAKNKCYIALRMLMDAGCDVNVTDNEGRAALHYASQKASGVELLLNAGADPNVCDKQNNTPLLVAATEGFDKIVSLLTSAKSDVNIANVNSKKTALHILSLKGHSNCIEDLVLRGADINSVDGNFKTPLWYATCNNRYEVVKLLLKANSHVDLFQCRDGNPTEACPVRMAFEKGFANIIKLFILTGYDKAHVKECLTGFCEYDKIGEELSEWLTNTTDVMALRGLCRKWIRHHLGIMFYHDLKTLPIPDKIRDYLLMKELDTEIL